MMRIAFVAGEFHRGGATTFILFLSAALRRLGIPAEAFSFSGENPLAEDFCEVGVPAHIHDEKALIYEDRLQKVYSDLRDFKPTAVFAVLGTESREVLRYLPRGVTRIGVFHDWSCEPTVQGPRYRHTMDHLVVVADYLRKAILRSDPQFPCTYVPHGIPISAEISPRNQNLSEPLRLLYYGRFQEASKGVRMFPKIAAALKAGGVPFRWTFHGYGSQEEFLKSSFANEIKTGQVVFSPPVHYKNLSAIIRKHDIYMLASTNEGGPLTLLESMSLGLVPVCGDIPCLIQEVITAENGFRVPRGEPDAYAAAIGKLHRDRILLERLSSNARNTITAHYTAEAMAKRYIALLNTIQAGQEADWPLRIQPQPILGVPFPSSLLQRFSLFRHMRRFLQRTRNDKKDSRRTWVP